MCDDDFELKTGLNAADRAALHRLVLEKVNDLSASYSGFKANAAARAGVCFELLKVKTREAYNNKIDDITSTPGPLDVFNRYRGLRNMTPAGGAADMLTFGPQAALAMADKANEVLGGGAAGHVQANANAAFKALPDNAAQGFETATQNFKLWVKLGPAGYQAEMLRRYQTIYNAQPKPDDVVIHAEAGALALGRLPTQPKL